MAVLRAPGRGPASEGRARDASEDMGPKAAERQREAPASMPQCRKGVPDGVERSGDQPVYITAATGAALVRPVWVTAQIDQAASAEQESSTSPRT
ncbi:hypothetical protein MPEAHAMD_1505 [Methylobacterium frigidaeris]|uniref:Uncharacterized protein n=1 Tax=Methylobacterium frigidaeris TaxID=2038277 RepID=A0AA37H8T1_9HYPH|nr:hypothetical protein MPEAHAMD_1505 [Methylobacterium frigidaeris]